MQLKRLPESERTAGQFFVIDQASELFLRRVRRNYIDAMAVDAAEDEEPDQEGDEDDA
jgi:hypothetical protein